MGDLGRAVLLSKSGVTKVISRMETGARGVSARVDTEVAMAFAASWNPFV